MSSKTFHVTKSDVVSFELKTFVNICFFKDAFNEHPSVSDFISIDGKIIIVSRTPFVSGNFIFVPVNVSYFMNFL